MAISPKMLEDSSGDEFLYTSFDYSAEELRIAANLSREPNWVDAFVHGDDIHKRTAVAIWGEEHYNRDYRKMQSTPTSLFCMVLVLIHCMLIVDMVLNLYKKQRISIISIRKHYRLYSNGKIGL